MDLELKGRTVLITGASKGIGLACADVFVREGARVIITGRDASRLAPAVESLKKAGASDVAIFAGDLAQGSERERLFAAHGEVDILVNNAGAIPSGSLFDIDMTTWQDAWQLKVFGYIHMMQLYLAAMKQRGQGVIVNVIGTAGQVPRWDYVCGAAGNASLIALTRAIGGKSVDWNVRVFGINPAGTRTDRIETMRRTRAKINLGDEERWQEGLDKLPFGRLAEAREIADLTAVLASPRGSYVSGTVLDVDGGQFFKD